MKINGQFISELFGFLHFIASSIIHVIHPRNAFRCVNFLQDTKLTKNTFISRKNEDERYHTSRTRLCKKWSADLLSQLLNKFRQLRQDDHYLTAVYSIVLHSYCTL